MLMIILMVVLMLVPMLMPMVDVDYSDHYYRSVREEFEMVRFLLSN